MFRKLDNLKLLHTLRITILKCFKTLYFQYAYSWKWDDVRRRLRNIKTKYIA